MADDDKPFHCFEDGCKMRFTNEDHLAVHMKKHDMSLALNLGSSSVSPLGLFLDQTPTPTKFLRNCEEVGLFQELNKNPFEEAFKKAADAPEESTSVGGIPIPGPLTSQLDTPIPPSVSTPPSMQEDLEQNIKALDQMKEAALSSIVPKKRKKFLSSQNLPTSTTSDDDVEMFVASSSTSTDDVIVVDKEESQVVSSSTKESETTTVSPMIPSNTVQQSPKPVLVQPSQIFLQLPNGQTIPVQLPGGVAPAGAAITPQGTAVPIQLNPGSIQPQPAVIQTIPAALPSNLMQKTAGTSPAQTTLQSNLVQKTVIQGTSNVVPSSVGNIPSSVVQRTVSPATITLGSSGGLPTVIAQQQGGVIQPTVQTIISPHQTDSQITPVKSVISQQHPDTQSNIVRTVISPVHKIGTQKTPPKSTGAQAASQSLTKQRLKAALQQQTTPSGNVKIAQIFQLRQEVKQEPQMSPLQMDSASTASTSDTNVSSPEELMPVSVQHVKMESDDPEDRRKKFLERNRAAAARCRQKRKHWIVSLESKSEELSAANNKLQNEVSLLRGEVAQLKTLLLAHKDCPVTLQQKAQGQLAPAFSQMESSSSKEPVVNGTATTSSVEQEASVAMTSVGAMTTSVITGPNTIAMIPTVVNTEHFLNKQNGS